jgi:hypothetical protein
MYKLHAATGPNRVSDLELLFCTCYTSTPAPFAIVGRIASIGAVPCKPYRAFRLRRQRVWNVSASNHISRARASNSASGTLASGGECQI